MPKILEPEERLDAVLTTRVTSEDGALVDALAKRDFPDLPGRVSKWVRKVVEERLASERRKMLREKKATNEEETRG